MQNLLLETPVQCPYCWERFGLLVDTSIELQEYVEDCHVCCQPIIVNVFIDNAGEVAVGTRCENE